MGEWAIRPEGAGPPLTSCSDGARRSRSASHAHSGRATATSSPHVPSPARHESKVPLIGAVTSDAIVAPTTSPVP